jgi:threonine synthase
MAVQASLTNPVTVAYRNRGSVEYQEPLTDAGAIAVGYPTYGDQAVEGIKATEGACIDVSDREMDKERRVFYQEYGLRVEMAGVASVVAFKKSKVKGKSVAVITGGNTLKP